MKDLIKNILLEQTETVPSESWPGKSNGRDPKGEHVWNKQSITKSMFFKGVKLMVRYNSENELIGVSETDQNIYDRAEQLDKFTKLVGVRTNSEGLTSKILYAAIDNYEGIKNGSKTSYNQLYLRPLRKFEVEMFEDVNEYKTVYYTVTLDAFAEVDINNMINHDDDGEFHQYDWPHIDVETHEYDLQDRGIRDGSSLNQKGFVYTHTNSSHYDNEQITESKLKAGPEENDIISELEELLGNKELTEKNVRNILTKYKTKPLTEQLLKEQTISSEAEQAAISNQQHITIVEAKFMANIKKRFDSSTIAKLVEMAHYDLSDNQEIKPLTNAFGITNQMRTSQLINLIWDNMDLDEFSSFVGELAPKLQYIEITQEYAEVTEGRYVASTGSWGVDYENTACQLKNDFWNYDPDLKHIRDDSHDIVQGSERWVEISIDGNTVWEDEGNGGMPIIDNEYNLDNLSC